VGYSIFSSVPGFTKYWKSSCKSLSDDSRVLIPPGVRGSVKVNVAVREEIGDWDFVPGVESHSGFVWEGS